MGIVEGCLSTTIYPDLHFLWEVPQKWTLEEASSIPLSYAAVSSMPRIKSLTLLQQTKQHLTFISRLTTVCFYEETYK